jgi:eukaryotic-like serine/threonine-protein kinase
VQEDDLIGEMLGHYRILAPLGQGGMARVYRAHQENLDREVAVKVLPPWYATDRNFVERFNQEARLVARLSHANIVMVHDAGEQNGHIYIVMQLVDGGTLKQRLDQIQAEGKTMDVVEANRIFKQLASALGFAHEQGIIHRDVKPVNVLMDRSGRPILSDFGIAKVLASTREQLTRPGTGVGTPEYMSPEQCRGEAVDARSDIYSLGVMLFEALTGRTPFQADSYPALAHSHIYELPPRPSSLNPAITPAVEQVILTALMKEAVRRYQRVIEMADALESAVTQQQKPGDALRGMAAPFAQAGLSQDGALQAPVQVPAGNPYAGPLTLYVCPNCQNANKPQTRFCTKCGFPLKACSFCGSQNPVGNRFCSKCGKVLPPGLPR